MSDHRTNLPTFIRPFFDAETQPYLFLAGLQAIVSFLGALLITTGLLG